MLKTSQNMLTLKELLKSRELSSFIEFWTCSKFATLEVS